MSEQKKRELSEIQQDYQNLCTKAGHVNYQIVTLKKDLALINDSLQNLNQEAAALKAAEPAPAVAVVEETPSE